MATPATPNRELLQAMEELGLLGWLPSRRWAVRAERRIPVTTPPGEGSAQPTALAIAPSTLVLGGASIAATLIALGGGIVATDLLASRSAGRVLRTWGTVLLCAAGLAGAWVLTRVGRRRHAR